MFIQNSSSRTRSDGQHARLEYIPLGKQSRNIFPGDAQQDSMKSRVQSPSKTHTRRDTCYVYTCGNLSLREAGSMEARRGRGGGTSMVITSSASSGLSSCFACYASLSSSWSSIDCKLDGLLLSESLRLTLSLVVGWRCCKGICLAQRCHLTLQVQSQC